MPVQRYRKKPVVVKAIQWTYDNTEEVARFCTGVGGVPLFIVTQVRHPFPRGKAKVFDHLHRSWIEVEEHDWLVRGILGEFYPVKPGIFETTHGLEVATVATPAELDELRARLEIALTLYSGTHGQPVPMAVSVNGGRLLYGEVSIQRGDEPVSEFTGGAMRMASWHVEVHAHAWPETLEPVTLRMGTVDHQDLEGQAYGVELSKGDDGWRTRFAGTGPLRFDEMAGR